MRYKAVLEGRRYAVDLLVSLPIFGRVLLIERETVENGNHNKNPQYLAGFRTGLGDNGECGMAYSRYLPWAALCLI